MVWTEYGGTDTTRLISSSAFWILGSYDRRLSSQMILLIQNHQPNQVIIVFCQDEQKPYHLTFVFGLVRRSGTHNGGHYAYLDAVLSQNQKLGNTVFVRLDKKQ